LTLVSRTAATPVGVGEVDDLRRRRREGVVRKGYDAMSISSAFQGDDDAEAAFSLEKSHSCTCGSAYAATEGSAETFQPLVLAVLGAAGFAKACVVEHLLILSTRPPLPLVHLKRGAWASGVEDAGADGELKTRANLCMERGISGGIFED
jgi:hypothetical protein